MNFVLNIIIFIICIFVYLHIFLHFKINPKNEIYQLFDPCSEKLSNNIYLKLPFYFDGITIVDKFEKKNCKVINKTDKYILYHKTYEKINMLEPYVKSFPINDIIEFKNKNGHFPLHYNLHCRNFYIVKNGRVKITCIHPKYKNNFTELKDEKFDTSKKITKFINENEHFIQIELHKNSILFIPNYWLIFIENIENNSSIERIQYSTILNQFNFIRKYI
jgi:hypothetical protein